MISFLFVHWLSLLCYVTNSISCAEFNILRVTLCSGAEFVCSWLFACMLQMVEMNTPTLSLLDNKSLSNPQLVIIIVLDEAYPQISFVERMLVCIFFLFEANTNGSFRVLEPLNAKKVRQHHFLVSVFNRNLRIVTSDYYEHSITHAYVSTPLYLVAHATSKWAAHMGESLLNMDK